MKRILYISFLLCLTAVTSFAATTTKRAYYIDFKSGAVQTLWTDWVDSMKVSKIGLDGVEQPDYATQEIWLSDTVLRYSLDDIEQISFVTPAPVFKPGVIRFEDGLEKYITGCDSLTVFLQPDTPEKLLPKPKDFVCYMRMTEIFPAAFAGEVVSVRNVGQRIEMECTLASLLDIFDTYYSTWEEEEELESRAGFEYDSGHNDHDFQHHKMEWKPKSPYHFEISPYLKGITKEPLEKVFNEWQLVDKYIHPKDTIKATLSKKLAQVEYVKGLNVTYEFQPDMEIRVTTTITRRRLGFPSALYVCIHAKGSFTNSLTVAAFAKLSSSGLPRQISLVDVPMTPNRFVTPYLGAGFFYSLGVEVGAGLNITNEYQTNWLYNFAVNDEVPLKNMRVKPKAPAPTTTTFGAHLKGSFAMGLFMELGFKFLDKNLLGIIAEGTLGVKAEGNVSIPILGVSPEENAWVYDKLRENRVSVAPYWGVGLKLNVNDKNVFGNQLSYESQIGKPWFERSLVPEFSDLKADRKKSNLSDVEAESGVSSTCLFPWKIGVGAFDKNKKLVKKIYYQDTYRTEKDFNSYQLDIEGLSAAKEFSVKPLIELANLDIPCAPDATVKKVLTVTTGKAKNVTSSQAVLTGKVENAGEFDLDNGNIDVKCFLRNGTELNLGKSVTSSKNGKDIEFEVKVNGLMPSSDYSYQATYTIEDEEVCGEALGFQTEDAEIVTLPVEYACAGTAYLRSAPAPEVKEVTYLLCEGVFETVEEIMANEKLEKYKSKKWGSSWTSCTVSFLVPEKEYTVCATVEHEDGETSYGELVYFKTKSASEPIEQDNRAALTDLYNQLPESSKEELYNWSLDSPLCYWWGVDHKENGNMSLSLEGETLSGSPSLNGSSFHELYLTSTSFDSFSYSGRGASRIDISQNKYLNFFNLHDYDQAQGDLVLFVNDNEQLRSLNLQDIKFGDGNFELSGRGNDLQTISVSNCVSPNTGNARDFSIILQEKLPLLHIKESSIRKIQAGRVGKCVIENSYVESVNPIAVSGTVSNLDDALNEIQIIGCKDLTRLDLCGNDVVINNCVFNDVTVASTNVMIANSTFSQIACFKGRSPQLEIKDCRVDGVYVQSFTGNIENFLKYLEGLR